MPSLVLGTYLHKLVWGLGPIKSWDMDGGFLAIRNCGEAELGGLAWEDSHLISASDFLGPLDGSPLCLYNEGNPSHGGETLRF